MHAPARQASEMTCYIVIPRPATKSDMLQCSKCVHCCGCGPLSGQLLRQHYRRHSGSPATVTAKQSVYGRCFYCRKQKPDQLRPPVRARSQATYFGDRIPKEKDLLPLGPSSPPIRASTNSIMLAVSSFPTLAVLQSRQRWDKRTGAMSGYQGHHERIEGSY